jgi:hypothetical protein
VWAGLDKTGYIYHYPLTGFDASGRPTWGPGIPVRIPESIKPLTRIVYLADSDTMILGQGIVGSTDWTSIGTRIEVYHGWSAGNTTAPNPVINLTHAGAKSIDAAGSYLFVGYWFSSSGQALPNIDAFNLATGNLDATLVNTSTGTVDASSAIDSMYGIRAYLRSTGEYVVTKNNVKGSSITVYRWTP